MSRRLMLAQLLILAAMALLLGGCATGRSPFAAAEPAPPHVLAACPPLVPLRRVDPDALTLRVAEVERWYEMCRHAATSGKPARAPRVLPS